MRIVWLFYVMLIISSQSLLTDGRWVINIIDFNGYLSISLVYNNCSVCSSSEELISSIECFLGAGDLWQ